MNDSISAVIADTAIGTTWFRDLLSGLNETHWAVFKMIGLTLLVIMATIVLFGLTKRLFLKIIDEKIVANCDKWFKDGIRFRNIRILSSAKLTMTALFASKILRYAIYALLLYTALPMIFIIFPATRPIAALLFSWIATPAISMGENFIAYLPKLLRIILIIVVMRYILKFLRYVATEIEGGRLTIPGFYSDWAHATYNLLRMLVYAFTIVLIFPLLPESESTVFKGVSVFIGVLFSIGSSSVISNMVAGMVITYMRSFKIGDRVKVGEIFGDVTEKTLFVIRVQTVKKEVVTVPNATVLASNIVNYSVAAGEDKQGIILYQDVSVCYDVTWERANRLLIEAALKTKHVLPDPQPFILTKTLGDNAITYQVNIYTKRPDIQAIIYSDLNRNILQTLQGDGVDMTVPVYEVLKEGK